MGLLQTLRQLSRRLWPKVYRYPAQDIYLGDRQLHLVGSIHMGTQNMLPLPDALLDKLRSADALIVEADITASESPFSDSAHHPPLAQRLSEPGIQQVQRLCTELGIDFPGIDTLPAWQVALMLQARQAQRLGLRADCGIDYQLLQAASALQKRVIELEGAEAQISLLKSLPEDGMPLLDDTLEHWHVNARLLQTMVSWWLEAPPENADKLTLPGTFSSGLNDVLMHRRNQNWCQQLHALPPGNYVVAVGALHLYGEGNLPQLLRR